MTFFIEIDGPFLWKPGFHRTRHMTRAWWGFIAIGWIPYSLFDQHRKIESGELVWQDARPPSRL